MSCHPDLEPAEPSASFISTMHEVSRQLAEAAEREAAQARSDAACQSALNEKEGR